MYKLTIVLIVTLLFARFCTGCHSGESTGKYIVIKNRILAKILIDDTTWGTRRKIPKGDRNKMSLAGLVFYLANAFVILLTVTLPLVSDIPCVPLEINTGKLYLHADTMNEKIPVVGVMVLLCVEMAYSLCCVLKSRSEIEGKWLRIFVAFVSVFGLLICGIGVITMLLELMKF